MRKIKIIILAHLLIPLLVFCLVLMVIIPGNEKKTNPIYHAGGAVSDKVTEYEALVYKYAELHYIRDYARYLIAIMEVETGGQGIDVMQSLGSSGIPEDEWTVDMSIDYACAYFASLYWKAASKGCDIDTVIQAYNYGGGYIDYVAQNGKEHSYLFASNYAASKSSGKKVVYNNELAVKTNGGWRYDYGNMCGAARLRQHLLIVPD